MNLYLHTSKFDAVAELWEPAVLGTPLFSLRFRDQPELHSLLLTNSSGAEYDSQWDLCFPTPFGFGLAADWLEENTEKALVGAHLWHRDLNKPYSECFTLLVSEFRRRFSGAAGH